MGRQDHAVELAERRIRGERLDREHVDRGPGDPPLLDRGRERCLVHQVAARRVDEHGRRLHQLEPLGVDQTVGLIGVRHVQRDDVGVAQQLVQPHELHLELQGALAGEIGIVSQHVHPEGAGELGDVPADAPQTHDPQRLGAELRALEPFAVPLATAHGIGGPRDAPHEGEQQGDRMLGRTHGVGARRVHHRDAPPGRGVHVDVVHAGARPGDHAQVGRVRQQVRRDPCLAPHDQCVRLSQLALEHFMRFASDGRNLDVGRIVQLLEARLCDPVGDDDAKRHESDR